MTNKSDAISVSFDAIVAMAKEERTMHPDHEHFREVDRALEALRHNVKSYLSAAGTASSIGNIAEADHLRAQAAIIVAQAQPIWAARVEAARAERTRVARGARIERDQNIAQLTGCHPPGRGAGVSSAAHTLASRLDALRAGLGHGDEAAFNARLDDMEAALTAFRSTVGIARRESRLRVSAASAAAAVGAVSDQAKAA